MRSSHRTVLFGFAAMIAIIDFMTAQTLPRKASEPAPLGNKERERRRQALDRELNRPFENWLNEDVAYIITDEERQAFKRLQNAEEREKFVELFWGRRDPTPDTQENETREEHYRRIAYANEHYASGIPGWKTDRGRMYIMHGPPDEIESHPSGAAYQRLAEQGGGETRAFPFETWRYRHIPGVGDDVIQEFVDRTMTGEYRFTIDSTEKDALRNLQPSLPNPEDRISRQSARDNPFERLKLAADIHKPRFRFPDLERVSTDIAIRYNLLPFELRTDFLRITGETVMSAITLKLRLQDLTFQNEQGVQRGLVNIFGRVISMTGQTVSTFEEVVQVDIPADQFSKYLNQSRVYWQALPLRSGRYRLKLVLKDVHGGNFGTQDVLLSVPRYDDETLSVSSLILADEIEKMAGRQIGKGQFVLGTSKVRPSVSRRFVRDQRLGVYLQVYNLTLDANQKPSAIIEYSILRDERPVLRVTEGSEKIEGAAHQMTIARMLPLAELDSGKYTLQVKITDRLRKRSIAPSATFTVHD